MPVARALSDQGDQRLAYHTSTLLCEMLADMAVVQVLQQWHRILTTTTAAPITMEKLKLPVVLFDVGSETVLQLQPQP